MPLGADGRARPELLRRTVMITYEIDGIVSSRLETATLFGNGVCAAASLKPASAVWLGNARRRALRPRAGPAGWRFVLAHSETPGGRTRDARRRKGREGDGDHGERGQSASVMTRWAENAAFTMVMLAWRGGITAALRNANLRRSERGLDRPLAEQAASAGTPRRQSLGKRAAKQARPRS